MSKILIPLAIALMIAFALQVADRTIITYKQVDNYSMLISCGNGAKPTVKDATEANTILISCVLEAK